MSSPSYLFGFFGVPVVFHLPGNILVEPPKMVGLQASVDPDPELVLWNPKNRRFEKNESCGWLGQRLGPSSSLPLTK